MDDYQVIDTNYWKDVKKEIDTVLDKLGEVCLLMHNSIEFKEIVGFLNKLPGSDKVLYISLTRTFGSLKPYFENLKSEIFVVDCVSTGLFNKETSENCVFAFPPNSLSEMVEMISKSSQGINADYIVIDSLSLFIDFSSNTNKSKILYDFLRDLKKFNLSPFSKKILLYDSNLSNMKNLPSFDVDTILRIEVVKDKVNWQG